LQRVHLLKLLVGRELGRLEKVQQGPELYERRRRARGREREGVKREVSSSAGRLALF
jgi:hypothetical protein